MNDSGDLQRRLEGLERKLDDIAAKVPAAVQKDKSRRRGIGHVFLGIAVVILGLIWLGQNLGIEWLNGLKFWPVVMIVFGLYLIFGDRGR